MCAIRSRKGGEGRGSWPSWTVRRHLMVRRREPANDNRQAAREALRQAVTASAVAFAGIATLAASLLGL